MKCIDAYCCCIHLNCTVKCAFLFAALGLPAFWGPHGWRADPPALSAWGVSGRTHHPQHHASVHQLHQVITGTSVLSYTTWQNTCIMVMLAISSFYSLIFFLSLVLLGLPCPSLQGFGQHSWGGVHSSGWVCWRGAPDTKRPDWILQAARLRVGARGETVSPAFTHQTSGPLQRGGKSFKLMLILKLGYLWICYIIEKPKYTSATATF